MRRRCRGRVRTAALRVPPGCTFAIVGLAEHSPPLEMGFRRGSQFRPSVAAVTVEIRRLRRRAGVAFLAWPRYRGGCCRSRSPNLITATKVPSKQDSPVVCPRPHHYRSDLYYAIDRVDGGGVAGTESFFVAVPRKERPANSGWTHTTPSPPAIPFVLHDDHENLNAFLLLLYVHMFYYRDIFFADGCQSVTAHG